MCIIRSTRKAIGFASEEQALVSKCDDLLARHQWKVQVHLQCISIRKSRKNT